jgi:ribosomal protein S18 acetylase RimI-like enzyme
MNLRLAKLSDASSIAALSIEVWVGTYLKQGVSSGFADYVLEEFTPQKMASLISDPNQTLMVSQNNDGIDGYIRLSRHITVPVAGVSGMEVTTLYVQPSHKGLGIGKALLQSAMADCRAHGGKCIWLTTNAQNSPAIRFYLSQGFRQIGTTEFRIDGQGYLNNVYAFDL